MMLDSEIVERLIRHMPLQSGEVVLLAFVKQRDGTYIMAAPISLCWPEMIAAVAHQREILQRAMP
jgi:hypothetical protein